MPAVAVIGAHWGDEGKGRVIDFLAANRDVVARYAGGANAGHTVINDLGTFKLNLVPAGIFNPDCICVIGNGVVVNPPALVSELKMLTDRGVAVDGLRISERAHVVLPHHLALDVLEEQARGAHAIGTTGNGIGPAYVDKTAREGIRMGDLIRPETFRERLAQVLARKNRLITQIYGGTPIDLNEVLEDYGRCAEKLAPYVTETGRLLRDALKQGKRVLLEGAQATMLDIDFGTYPYVTSSHPVAAGASLGVGIGPNQIDEIIAVVKAYSSRVGGGPFVTELVDETGERIREIGQEYGTRTGRPRRCGWFDAVVGRYSCEVNGVTRLAVTRLDILDTFDEIKLAVAYELDGKRIDWVPANLDDLERCTPVYETFPGWKAPTSHIRNFDDLPANARRYVERIGDLLGAPVDMVGVGASRMQAIVRRPLP